MQSNCFGGRDFGVFFSMDFLFLLQQQGEKRENIMSMSFES